MSKKKSHGKYSSEVEKIRMLRSLNEMMKTSDMENALLSNSARDSETVSDGVVDDMLSKIGTKREKDIQAVERITAYSMGQGRAPQRLPRDTPSRRKARPARRQKPKPAMRQKPGGKWKAAKPRKASKPKRRR